MYDELVKRLKEDKSWVEQGTTQTEHEIAEHIQQAADAIEELTGFVQEAERDRDEYRERLDKANDAIEELSAIREEQKAEIILMAAEDKPRWIPVTERLPEVGVRVLCYCRANSFDVFRMTDEGHWQYGNRSIYMKGYVTHWMPLPEPPKEE